MAQKASPQGVLALGDVSDCRDLWWWARWSVRTRARSASGSSRWQRPWASAAVSWADREEKVPRAPRRCGDSAVTTAW